MGWKNIKEAYDVVHQICVTREGICIGSGNIPNLIVISREGCVKKRYEDHSNSDLTRYQRLMDESPSQLKQLTLSPDIFNHHIRVYTYEKGELLELWCEKPGYPNVTHDGRMMYDNTFFLRKAEAIQYGIVSEKIAIRHRQEKLERTQAELQVIQAELATRFLRLSNLETSNRLSASGTM
ncbi:MAG: hypothetical protein ACYC3W_07030 [Candidatus Nanopelagicales bacterium]